MKLAHPSNFAASLASGGHRPKAAELPFGRQHREPYQNSSPRHSTLVQEISQQAAQPPSIETAACPRAGCEDAPTIETEATQPRAPWNGHDFPSDVGGFPIMP
jgi:hypothetical protein